MANIIEFEGQNAVYTGEGCLDLPALKSKDHLGADVIGCCYQLTPFERGVFRDSGVLYHHLYGLKPQRDFLTGYNPFLFLQGGQLSFGTFLSKQPEQIIPTTDHQGYPLSIIVWSFTQTETAMICENDGLAFSYVWAVNPQPQYVTSLNPWVQWPHDPDQNP